MLSFSLLLRVFVSLRYAVHVTGLPYNATKDEVLAHFNNL